MDIECPQCHIEFNTDDVAYTLRNRHFKCPVCNKQIPSPLVESQGKNRHSSIVKYILSVIICVILAILAAFYVINNYNVNNSLPMQPPPVKSLPPVSDMPSYHPPPAASVINSAAPIVTLITPVPKSSLPPQNKLQLVEKIAADFHKTHTYMLEDRFACLDMAINIWNQLMTNGIEAKIMGGTLKEDIMNWSYRLLVMNSDHAWVVAKISPTDKVAIETTSGIVIKPGMKNSSLYFKGIEFDNPAQVKEFENLRTRLVMCKEAHELVDDWNKNIAGEKRATVELIEKKSKTEQRLQDCANVINALDKFKSRVIYY
ncbi:MAG: hypothetical protein M0P16_03785 [Syntrophales bacterium]|jgi:hypothetical protein|nr:hypothetical protein [Syntrophales bacterium]MCK9390333.1 hypothetical protein [Syntrophales bacterium]